MNTGDFRFWHTDAIDQWRRILQAAISGKKPQRGGQRSAPRERDELAERLAANGVLR